MLLRAFRLLLDTLLHTAVHCTSAGLKTFAAILLPCHALGIGEGVNVPVPGRPSNSAGGDK